MNEEKAMSEPVTVWTCYQSIALKAYYRKTVKYPDFSYSIKNEGPIFCESV